MQPGKLFGRQWVGFRTTGGALPLGTVHQQSRQLGQSVLARPLEGELAMIPTIFRGDQLPVAQARQQQAALHLPKTYCGRRGTLVVTVPEGTLTQGPRPGTGAPAVQQERPELASHSSTTTALKKTTSGGVTERSLGQGAGRGGGVRQGSPAAASSPRDAQ